MRSTTCGRAFSTLTRMTRRRLAVVAAASVFALTAVACGGSKQPEAAPVTSGQPETTTTAAAPPPVYPLTGLPMLDPASADHPAVVVKMDNSPDARPQTGINQADIVYELLVEGITRYALVFHSETPDPVGPVRSARSSDPGLIANLNKPLLVWSGGNPGVTGEVTDAAKAGFLVDAGVNNFPADYFRDNKRVAPHNLYANLTNILADATPAGAGPPPMVFSYRSPTASSTTTSGATSSTTATGVESAGTTIDFGLNTRADYVWDAERKGWDRFQVDQAHNRAQSATVDPSGQQVSPANVVILFLQYGQSPADARSPMAESTGTGEALVLTDGKAIQGTWKRAGSIYPWELTDKAGNPIQLTPGRTWVALPQAGSAVLPIDRGTADELLAVRK